MTTGFGVDPVRDANNVPTQGMTSSDVRKIFGGLYSPGIITGTTVATSPTGMTYTVSPGVVAIPTATSEVVLAPVPSTVLGTSAPASGTRTDIIYVQQHFAGNEGDVSVVPGITSGTLPDRSLEIARYNVSAGSTTTNSAVKTGNTNYSIPYGGSLGTLFSATSTYNGTLVEAPGTNAYYLNGSITLPTDRRLHFAMSVAISTEDGQDGVKGTWVEPNFFPQLDNVDLCTWNFRATGSWTTYFFYYDTVNPVPAGTHTVRLRRNIFSPAGRKAAIHYGDGTQLGTNFSVTDLGVVQ